MSVLKITNLHATVAGQEILRGVDLEVRSGEVHALMGPNGSGKSTLSHVLMGRGDYAVTGGSVTIDGDELLDLPTHERAARGLFLALQYPVELPGVRLDDFLAAALHGQGRDADDLRARVATEADRLGVAAQFLERGLNVEFSGGEQKRAETLQLAVLRPKFAVLDEIDSGLDVDALRDVARRVEAMTTEDDLGVLAITHYARLLDELRPDVVHVLMGGRVVQTGGPELAQQLEETGYEGLAAALGVETAVEVAAARRSLRRPARLLGHPIVPGPGRPRQVVLECVRERFESRTHSELRQDVLDVRAHGRIRDVHVVRELPPALALQHALEHLAFRGGEEAEQVLGSRRLLCDSVVRSVAVRGRSALASRATFGSGCPPPWARSTMLTI